MGYGYTAAYGWMIPSDGTCARDCEENRGREIMHSTTGTSIGAYIEWVKSELEKKKWGSVGITFTICNGQIVDVEKISMDRDHFQLDKKD